MRTLLSIDTQDLQQKVSSLRERVDEKQFKRILVHTLRDTGRKAKTLTDREIRRDYQIRSRDVKSTFGYPKISTGTEISCLIPLRNMRGTIARKSGTYQALKNGPRAKVLKAGASLLPHRPTDNRIHFYIPSGRLAGHVFVRRLDGKVWYGKRKAKNGKVYRVKRVGSITHAVGIGVPQMPMNRSRENVQKTLLDYMGTRLEHYEKAVLSGYVGGVR